MPGIFDHPSAGMPTVFGNVSDPFYSWKNIQNRVKGFKSFAKPTTMATPRELAGAMTGFRGFFARMATSRIGRAVGELARTTARVAVETPRALWHPRMWGIAARGGSGSFLSSVARRAIGPGLVLGAFGLMAAGRNLLSGGYSMEGPGVAWGYTPGMTTPYEETNMEFSTINNTMRSMGATGSLAFALHNSRKG